MQTKLETLPMPKEAEKFFEERSISNGIVVDRELYKPISKKN